MIPQRDELIYLGLDVSRDSIAVGTLRPAEEVPDVTKVFNDEPSVRRLVGAFDDPRRLVACLRRGRRATTWPACWPGWACAATWWPRR